MHMRKEKKLLKEKGLGSEKVRKSRDTGCCKAVTGQKVWGLKEEHYMESSEVDQYMT